MRTWLLAALGVTVILAWAASAHSAPPRMKPLLQISLDQGEGKPALILDVYDAAPFRRADFQTAGAAGLDQVFWAAEQWDDFQKLLKKLQVPGQGTVQLKLASEEGQQVRAKIEELVVKPARAEAQRRAIEEQRQRDLKNRDRKGP